MNKFIGIGGVLVVLGICAVKAYIPEAAKQYCAHPRLQTPSDRTFFAEKCNPDHSVRESVTAARIN